MLYEQQSISFTGLIKVDFKQKKNIYIYIYKKVPTFWDPT